MGNIYSDHAECLARATELMEHAQTVQQERDAMREAIRRVAADAVRHQNGQVIITDRMLADLLESAKLDIMRLEEAVQVLTQAQTVERCRHALVRKLPNGMRACNKCGHAVTQLF